MNVCSPLSELGRTRGRRRLTAGLDYPLCGCPVGEYMEVGWFMRWYPYRLMRPTHQSCVNIGVCLFKLPPRISSAIDDIPFSEQEDEVI